MLIRRLTMNDCHRGEGLFCKLVTPKAYCNNITKKKYNLSPTDPGGGGKIAPFLLFLKSKICQYGSNLFTHDWSVLKDEYIID
jgi:hypothetical protein